MFFESGFRAVQTAEPHEGLGCSGLGVNPPRTSNREPLTRALWISGFCGVLGCGG